jgi:hypothetical protein
MIFFTFLKFFLKFREQIPCRETTSNALTIGKLGFPGYQQGMLCKTNVASMMRNLKYINIRESYI